ncbi:hypothetical protein VSS37_03770 [Candidatus Thiothrix sp. Deng01]|uniref:Uncharacterized protein n=1 Tax=Candidatus Thiothrix phosphatis TaxID=3112415 RepID=A0ABU6CVD1_9GAMM|nr:hypothetical protein [Candidatus Thiothrix sp. Deng01]MEB4590089.1 hypothetical protein [Candidatus Thiothrix sp. Deng01]
MADCSIGSCAPGTGARLDAVNDRLAGVNSCKQSITASPQLVALKGTVSLGGIAGDWETVRLLFAADNEHMPPGTRVIGSDGNIYKLIGDDNVDPATDSGSNWVNLSASPIAGMEGAAKAGAPLGDWQKARDAYAAIGRKIPAGAVVIGSDGVLYRLTGANPDADPATDNGANWTPVAPAITQIFQAVNTGGVAGDWAKVKAALDAAGKAMPVGTIVVGSDGSLYRLVGNPAVDPATDNGTNWVNLTLTAHQFIQLTF